MAAQVDRSRRGRFGLLEWSTKRRQQRANRLTRAIWHEMHRVGKSVGAETLFFYAPEMYELVLEMQGKQPQLGRALFQRFALEVEEDAVTLDVTDDFRLRMLEGEQFKAGHWDARGHQLIAEALEKKILSEQLLR